MKADACRRCHGEGTEESDDGVTYPCRTCFGTGDRDPDPRSPERN